MTTIRLGEIAYARSGDKGSSANIGVIAYTYAGYGFIYEELTEELVYSFFVRMGLSGVVRYELPNLWALNFILENVLSGGGSRSIRIDAQGKVLGQALLQLPLEISPQRLLEIRPNQENS